MWNESLSNVFTLHRFSNVIRSFIYYLLEPAKNGIQRFSIWLSNTNHLYLCMGRIYKIRRHTHEFWLQWIRYHSSDWLDANKNAVARNEIIIRNDSNHFNRETNEKNNRSQYKKYFSSFYSQFFVVNPLK